MAMAPFLLYTLVGATMWNMFLVYLGVRLKENWRIIQRYTHILDYFVVAALIGAVIYLYLKLRQARNPA
jgi:membrane protein DedA with SNARE-associated domain